MSANFQSIEMAQIKAREILRRIVPWIADAKSKQRTNYKGTRGRIGVVGGARDYSGAPYFASISTMNLGADLAYVVCSQGEAPAIKNYSPDLIVTPILDHPDVSEFDREMKCLFDRLHAIVVGPGLGRETFLQERAKRIIEQAKTHSIPLVFDADSLLLINQDPSIIKSYKQAILTPNRIELQRMLDIIYAPKTHNLRNLPDGEINKLATKCASDLGVTILAKGKIDIICNSEVNMFTDEQSGSDRRCGGQGDILSGLAGVYLHWINQSNKNVMGGNKPIDNPVAWAAYLAAITTRKCNELAFQEHKQGMLASHMTSKIQDALELLLDSDKEIKHNTNSPFKYYGVISNDEVKRYTRQMIMEEFGPQSQLKLKNSSAVIIGAGGLGCPSSVYLAAAGIGRLGIVDDDRVEVSNLHRQILHNTLKVGMLKTESIKQSILDINPNVNVETFPTRLNRANAVAIVEQYDFVIDATDNLQARYMISDACVVAKKPLVSGAALKMDGQLTVYNYDKETPCFRCLFPEPPPPNAVGSCSENGVLGVIPGVIGVNQALEAIKLGAGLKPSYAGKMLIFDGQLGSYRLITIGKRRADCEACGGNSKLDRNLIDYDEFTGSSSCQKPAASPATLKPEERITMEQYRDILVSGRPHVLVDVRPLVQSEISRFDHALALPVMKMIEEPDEAYNTIKKALEKVKSNEIYVVCRKGIASQRGTRIIEDLFKGKEQQVVVKDLIGGMTTWAAKIDPEYSCL